MSSGMLRRDISRRFIIIIITSLSAGTHAGRACVSGRTLLTLLKLDEQTQADLCFTDTVSVIGAYCSQARMHTYKIDTR